MLYSIAMAAFHPPPAAGRFSDLKLAARSILGFWLFYFLTLLVRATLGGTGFEELLSRRTVAIGIGILITFLVYAGLRLFAARGSLRRMVIVAALLCIPASLLFAVVNFSIFFLSAPLVVAPTGAAPPSIAGEILLHQAPRHIADQTVTWYFFFAAWASFYVAMSSAAQLRLAERRAAEAERDAQSAQLRALRYQVNPHFLFNTLNSLSALIMGRRDEEAEKMVMNLSSFFRSTLSTDPTADVSLAEEIALQRLYLDIEQTRFPKRLKVDIAIPDALRGAAIPALLLQPLIENAIKYGVARARSRVTLWIRAEEANGGLRIIVENDGPQSDGAQHGTGVGLANVRQRLEARFGAAASMRYGPRPGGGFLVALSMPLMRA